MYLLIVAFKDIHNMTIIILVSFFNYLIQCIVPYDLSMKYLQKTTECRVKYTIQKAMFFYWYLCSLSIMEY